MTDALFTPCPTCHAQAGQRCKSAGGQTYGPARPYHAARRGGNPRRGKVTDSVRRQIGRIGGLTSWAGTVDRSERTDHARANGPGHIEYWLQRLPDSFATAEPDQRVAAAESAKRAYYHELARRSAVTRSARAAKRSKKLAHAVGEVHVPIIGRWAEKATP